MPAVTGDARVDKLLARMTLDEKLTLLEGEAEAVTANSQYQAGYLPGIPRLGIPSLKLTDGPPGVITKQDSTGMTSTMGVAATFSQSDAKANGAVIGRDAKALGQDLVLEPFVNMDRDTSWARSFNTFGEDPLLTGQTGAAEITGTQAQGVMAQVKHYIAFDGGFNNVTVDSQTSARDLPTAVHRRGERGRVIGHVFLQRRQRFPGLRELHHAHPDPAERVGFQGFRDF